MRAATLQSESKYLAPRPSARCFCSSAVLCWQSLRRQQRCMPRKCRCSRPPPTHRALLNTVQGDLMRAATRTLKPKYPASRHSARPLCRSAVMCWQSVRRQHRCTPRNAAAAGNLSRSEHAQSTQSQPCAPGLAPAATPRPAVPSRHIWMVIRSPEDGGNDHLARLRDLVDLEHREHLAHDLLVDLDDGGWSCSSRDDPCC